MSMIHLLQVVASWSQQQVLWRRRQRVWDFLLCY